MTWMNQLQLQEKYADSEFRKAFAELFALRWFLNDCLVASGYKPPDAFGDAISLTATGKEWVPRMQAAIRDISPPEINLALFIKFFHHELLIDVNTTNPETIRRVLDTEIVGGRIRYPWVYDRLLYDRFFDKFSGPTEELSYEETRELLENTPQGVFQVGDVVVGPFGVLNSSCHRFLPSLLHVPLWHCSDPSCGAIHPVVLSTGQSKFLEGVAFTITESAKAEGNPSEWPEFFRHLQPLPDYYDDMDLEDLPWLLANAFSQAELKNILRRLIKQHSVEMRQRFPKTKKFEQILSGSAEKISQTLTKAQCFQLILLMSDEDITSSVEVLTEKEVINIPSTETRGPKVVYHKGDWLDTSCEASRFGIRLVTGKIAIALPRLKRLIGELYKEEPQLDQLKWNLRHIEGESIDERLDTYLHIEDPRLVVRNLVFASPDILQRAFQNMRHGYFVSPSSPEQEEGLVDKILWKLGFDIGLYPPHQPLFWERLERFLQTARTYAMYNEHHRELIRSTGVNFFVSLEEVLDYSLSFTTWVLLSDHYGVTKFKCNFDDARRFMASRLNRRQVGSSEVEFDPDGKNTLYPLIQGFAILAKLCNEIIEGKYGEIKRHESELPGYYGKTDIELFPFLHKALILDLREADRGQIISLLKEFTTTLERSQVCDIRNRLEHGRRDFPNQEEIERVCSAVSGTLSKMEATGVCPLIHLYAGRTVDHYGRGTITFKDYIGRETTVKLPSQYSVCGLPSSHEPQIIVPSMHIGDSAELLRFEFEETSEYVQMWKDYPKRRPRVPSEEMKEQSHAERKQLEEQVL